MSSRKIKIRDNNHYKLTDKQNAFVSICESDETQVMLCIGPAGTTKTYLAVMAGLQLYNDKKIGRIIYIRSVAESAENKLGYLPGTEESKMKPYLTPLNDKLGELLTKTEMSFLVQNNVVQSEHVGFCRGQNWDNTLVILDEAQNCTHKEILTILTRVGKNSKLIMVGDPMQSDINGKSGLLWYYNLFNDQDSKDHGINTFEFDEEDILRSEIVKYITKKVKNANKK